MDTVGGRWEVERLSEEVLWRSAPYFPNCASPIAPCAALSAFLPPFSFFSFFSFLSFFCWRRRWRRWRQREQMVHRIANGAGCMSRLSADPQRAERLRHDTGSTARPVPTRAFFLSLPFFSFLSFFDFLSFFLLFFFRPLLLSLSESLEDSLPAAEEIRIRGGWTQPRRKRVSGHLRVVHGSITAVVGGIAGVRGESADSGCVAQTQDARGETRGA